MKGYVCDQCKNIVGRFDRVNPDTIRLQVHRPGVDIEKTEAHFCNWQCLSAFVQRSLEFQAECERNTRMMAQKYLDGQSMEEPAFAVASAKETSEDLAALADQILMGGLDESRRRLICEAK